MSLKKDRFNSFDKINMRFAINLAKNQNGLTGTNPSVGCVIVKNDEIISIGQTDINGIGGNPIGKTELRNFKYKEIKIFKVIYKNK